MRWRKNGGSAAWKKRPPFQLSEREPTSTGQQSAVCNGREDFSTCIAEVKNRATITGAIEIGRLPGVVQVTFLAPLDKLKSAGLLPLAREQYGKG
jgi:formamidase